MACYKTINNGTPLQLGVTITSEEVNFALYSKNATSIALYLLDPKTQSVLDTLLLDPKKNKTGDIWHIALEGLELPVLYLYMVKGPAKSPHYYGSNRLIIDPYAPCLKSPTQWGEQENSYRAYGAIIQEEEFNWENTPHPSIPSKDLIIYEMHVRGFTKDPSSNVQEKGTYLGLIEKIPYLKELGVNAVELIPIYEFYECEYKKKDPKTHKRLYNYWGYSPVHFFNPMNRYASSKELGAAKKEFKTLVKELHKNGIEVILDVVFNHTGEKKDSSEMLSFLGIDRSTYYLLDHGRDTHYTGCGNTLNVNHPIMRKFILDCLRYWVVEMHVDGFRFDLATVLNRDMKGNLLATSPLVETMSLDAVLSKTKLIAEPWDLGGYQLGGFRPEEDRWSEWNGKYRDVVRRFIKGDHHLNKEFANCICGSSWIFPARTASASLNFITCHDGFSLHDLVSYNKKHNERNGENNSDGNSNSLSWNSGAEGATTSDGILNLRKRQMKNFLLTLFLSRGIPMLLMGDEYGHEKGGNNNTWCQDNELNWFQWETLEKNRDFFRFVQRLIEIRKSYPMLQKETFANDQDITWHSVNPFSPVWDSDSSLIAFTLFDQKTGAQLYAAFNPTQNGATFILPPPPEKKRWHLLIDTFAAPPNDCYLKGREKALSDPTFYIQAYSSILLTLI